VHVRSAALCLSLALATSFAAPALANTKKELDSTLQAIDEARDRQSRLAGELEALTSNLSEIQSKTVKLADEIQKNEADLRDKENALSVLQKQMQAKQNEYHAQEKQHIALVKSMVHLSRTPRMAFVAQPASLPEVLRTGKVLEMTSEAVQQKANELSIQIQELAKLQTKIHQNRESIIKKQHALMDKRETLSKELVRREAMHRQLDKDYSREKEKIGNLSKKSSSLKELLASLERERKTLAGIGIPQAKPSPPGKPGSRSAKKPVVGDILQKYGSKSKSGESLKGVVLQTAANAQVVSPANGEVVFTGPFLEYGPMVIVRHDDGVHTLLAGLNQIQTDIGQRVLVGEPLGVMGVATDAKKLYVEVRKGSKPVDPTPWIGNFNIAQR